MVAGSEGGLVPNIGTLVLGDRDEGLEHLDRLKQLHDASSSVRR